MIDVLKHLPTSAMSEADLLRGGVGRGPVESRQETCACGGSIRVDDTFDDWLVARAVRVHNESTAHQRWAELAGWR